MIRGVIFDMDGTLVEPAIDFAGMRRAVGVPEGDILHVIETWSPERQREANAILERFEAEAALHMELRPGCLALLEGLGARDVRAAIITRNTHATVDKMTRLTDPHRFFPILDRTFHPPKPAPDSVHHVLAHWGMTPEEVVFVGDSSHDLETAERAGVPGYLVLHEGNHHLRERAAGVLTSLEELLALYETTR